MPSTMVFMLSPLFSCLYRTSDPPRQVTRDVTGAAFRGRVLLGRQGEYPSVHELSIAEALVEQVEEVRSSHEGRKVVAVGLRIGTWRLVVPESLTFYYESLTRGTPLEGSRLEIEAVVARARCEQCGEVFAVEEPWVVCPTCARVCSDLVSGQELDLVSVELED